MMELPGNVQSKSPDEFPDDSQNLLKISEGRSLCGDASPSLHFTIKACENLCDSQLVETSQYLKT